MVRLDDVSKIYRGRKGEVRALDDVSLHVETGAFVAIKGPSGSGKSTLLLTIGGMVRPTGGRVVVADVDVYGLSSRQRASFRAENIGFVFQMFHLVPYLNVLENVLLPTLADGRRRGGRNEALALLERFGMTRPDEASGSHGGPVFDQRDGLVRRAQFAIAWAIHPTHPPLTLIVWPVM